MSLLGFRFNERMVGTYRALSGGPDRPFHFEVDVICPDTSLRMIEGTARGRLTMEGVASNVHAEGWLRISPFWKRTVAYQLTFTGSDGNARRFEGHKTIRWLFRTLRSWTTLPGQVVDAKSGAVEAEVLARFDLRREFLPLLRSFRRAPKALPGPAFGERP
jgi:hypothetical protein